MTKKNRFALSVITLLFLVTVVGCGKKETNQMTVLTTERATKTVTRDILNPFAKRYKVAVKSEFETGPELLKKIDDPDTNGDVVELSQKDATAANNNKLVKHLDFKRLKNFKYLSADKQKLARETNSIPYTVETANILYNPKTVSKPVFSADLWNRDLVKELAIPDISTRFGPAMIVWANESYRERYMQSSVYVGHDVDTNYAFQALNELKPYTKTYSHTGDLIKLFHDNEIDVAVVGNASTKVVKRAIPYLQEVVPSYSTIANYQMVSIMKNSKNTKAAYEYLDYRISKEVQKTAAKSLNEGPVNEMAQKENAHYLKYGSNNAITVNYNQANKLLPEWTEDWHQIYN